MKQEVSSACWSTAATVLVVLSVLAGGVWFYCAEEHRLREDAQANLQAIAELKANRIIAWRAERLGDAAVLMESPFFFEGVERWMTSPQVEGEEDLLTRFRSLRDHYHYYDVLLTDPSGQVRLSLAGHCGTLHADAAQVLAAAFRERKPMLSDLHAGGTNQAPHLDLVVPLLAKNAETSKPAGAIILQIDAQQFLYPLIQSWPVPSRSAETLLVRRDGDTVLFLNDLRHQQDTALKLRIPLSRTDVPVVMAVLGKQGIVQGKDYRGVKVLSVSKAIPDSPWFMVAKVDVTEVLATQRLITVLILALVLAIVAAAAVSVGVIWQRNQKAHYRSLLQAEEELHASRRILERIINAIPVRVFWKDKDLVYLGCNAVFACDAGFADPKEIIGKNDYQMAWCDQAELYRRDDRQVIESGCSKLLIEEPQTTPEGNAISLLTNKIPLLSSEGEITGVLGTYVDITDRKLAERQQAEFAEQLKVINQDLQDFAHVVSHDLKAPLRAIRTLADWLATDYQDKLDPQGKENLRLLGSRVDRMQNLIDGVLQYSRIGRTEQKTEPVDLNRLVPEIIDNLGAPEHIAIHVEPDLPTVEADATRITQVFQNLLSNAIKYMDKPQGNITVGCVQDDGFWKLSVADNGPGIERKDFERIFKLFQTLARRDDCESTGVGLTVAKKIVEIYGGRIWVESEVGRGSTFFFTFPKSNAKVSDETLQTCAADV
jgi:signal transduction histidine kinase